MDHAGGPTIQLPLVTSTVSVVGVMGLVRDIDVQYLPIRIGWATTVQATQGLESPCVMLDLNQAGWLEGGGYSGVGRVKGDLQHGAMPACGSLGSLVAILVYFWLIGRC